MKRISMNGYSSQSENYHSTHGGKGWLDRQKSNSEEIQEGKVWYPTYSVSETATLKEVLLTIPHKDMFLNICPASYLMLEVLDGERLVEQAYQLKKVYESNKVKVHTLICERDNPYPNLLFLRDLLWATPEGVILCRTASQQRAGEERFVARRLSEIGIPIVMSIKGDGVFEGADALWLNSETVILGTGFRTNDKGARQIENFLSDIGVKTIKIQLKKGVQHLLGVMNFLAEDVIALNYNKAPENLENILLDYGYRIVRITNEEEINNSRGMNFVNLGNNKILMPKGASKLKECYQTYGCEVVECDISEYLKAAGGIGCLTGILYRR